MFQDVEKLVLRTTVGGIIAAHGAQKLFGVFDGPGLQGTAGFMEALGLRPGRYWGAAAALSEFGGGILTAAGLLEPMGPLGIMSAMAMATGKAHWGKPIFSAAGGAELPLTNAAAALLLARTGPGRYSLDAALDLHMPRWISTISILGAAGAVAYGLAQKPSPTPEAKTEARTTLQAGEEAQPPTHEG